MPHRRKTLVGTVRGRCGSCQQAADLSLYEVRPQRRVGELLKTDLDLRIDRSVTCSACERTYPVRSGDLDALRASDRDAGRPEGRRRHR